MQDPRIRLFAIIAISGCAFISVQGALLAILWWILFTPGPALLRRARPLLWAGVPVAIVAAAMSLTGEDGLSYGIRLAGVLLVAIYAFSAWKPGEFLGVCCWMLGDRRGFSIGLAGEMALTGMQFLEGEVSRVRTALRLKGQALSWRTMAPAATGLVVTLLARAEDQADLLMVRGYTGGGSGCPRFSRGTWDFTALGAAILFIFFAIMPVRDIFILLQ
jgi:energy-coupling factor transport system permease protein